MRADRLLSLLLLLQSRRRLTAEALALQLGVSTRTIYRDLETLSAAGFPVVAQSGPSGGVTLLAGWRTTLTGLTGPEIEALAAVHAPDALEDLGLSAALRRGLLKLAASLPTAQQPAAEHARQRLHVDGTGWFEGREPVPHLAQLRDAVWQDQRVRLAYRDVEGAASTREVEPYGLVIKAERWYLVAGTARGTRVFRGARIDTVERLDERFTRPPGFDLPAFWREWRERFARERPRFLTTLRLTAAGEDALRAIRPAAEHAAWIETPWAPDGTKTVTVDFEREAIALAQLVTIGPGVEVLSPDALRSRLGTLARELTALYDRQPR